jgi:uncharacterized protein YifN (PemK superfamily)
VEINYFDTDGNSLGKACYSDFNEILVPSFKEDYNNHLVLKFSNHQSYCWKILKCVIDNNQVHITIESVVNNPKSIQKIAKDNSSTPKKFLSEFSLVEVEFGFHSSVLQKDAGTKPNDIYSNALLNGEIHKKRPCIVLKTFEKVTQVIPLTSKWQSFVAGVDIVINMNSINDISHKYHVPTFALIDMIQTVSYDRVFPPRAVDGKFHNKTYHIAAGDKDNLKAALASLYNAGIQSKISNLTDGLSKLNKEKFRLIEVNKTIIAEKKFLETQIFKLGKSFGLNGDITSIIEGLSEI